MHHVLVHGDFRAFRNMIASNLVVAQGAADHARGGRIQAQRLIKNQAGIREVRQIRDRGHSSTQHSGQLFLEALFNLRVL